jgi:hypothetical protein
MKKWAKKEGGVGVHVLYPFSCAPETHSIAFPVCIHGRIFSAK